MPTLPWENDVELGIFEKPVSTVPCHDLLRWMVPCCSSSFGGPGFAIYERKNWHAPVYGTKRWSKSVRFNWKVEKKKENTDLLWDSNLKLTPFRGSRSTMRANQKSSRQQKPSEHIIRLGAIDSSSFTSPETAEAASTATSCCPLIINMKFRCSWPLMKCSLIRYISLFYFHFLEWHTVIYISNGSCSHSFNSPSWPDEETWAEKRNLKLQYFNNGVGLHCSVRGFRNLH